MPQPEYVLRSYGGGAATAQLTQEMGSTDTTFTITSTTGWTENGGTNPLGTVGPFTVVIDNGTASRESILCRSIDLTSGLVTVFVDTDGWSGRGYDSTSAVAHVPGGTSSGVMPAWSSLEAAEANQAVFDLLGAGGISSLGVPIGTTIDYRGMPSAVPANFMFEDGTAISRATYAACLTAITMAFTGTTSTANPLITAVGTVTVNGSTVNVTSLLPVGGQIQLVNSGGAIYTIQSVTNTSITVVGGGTGITAGTAGGITFFPHGAGDGSTTFNIPDSRGRTTMGQGQVNTEAQPNLYVGQVGGLSTVTLTVSQLPAAGPHTDPGHVHVTNAAAGSPPSNYQTTYTDPLTSATWMPGGAGAGAIGSTGVYTTFNSSNTTINATTGITLGGGTSHENKSPYSVATKIIRIQ